MLLIDRLLVILNKQTHPIKEAVQKAQVFEVTDLQEFLAEHCDSLSPPGINGHITGGVPIKPPYEYSWFEWITEDSKPSHPDSFGRLQTGILLFPTSKTASTKLLKPVPAYTEVLDHYDEFYNYLMFTFWYQRPRVAVIDSVGLLAGSQNMSNHFACRAAGGNTEIWPAGLLRLPMVKGMVDTTAFSPAVAMGSLALLNCKNITTESIPARPRTAREIKHGSLPRSDYKVLRLTLPVSQNIHDPSGELSTGVRLHLCRGHFKNLQSDRYKNKGWHWWPAHWKGRAELGTVAKSYSIQGKAGR